MKSRLVFLAKVLVSAALLWWLSQQLQWHLFVSYALSLPWWTLPACVGIYVMAQWLSAWRWCAFLQQLVMPVNQPTLFRWIMVGMIYNQLLPGTIGGDGYRIWQVSKLTGQSKAVSGVTVLAERASGLAIIIWVGAALQAFVAPSPHQGYYLPVWLTLTGLSLLTIGLLGLLPINAAWFKPVQQLIRRPWALGISFGLSLLVQGLMVVIHKLLAPELPWPVLAAAYFGVTILTMLPISLNGMGVREVGYVSLLATHCPPERAVSLSVLWFAVGLMTSLLGLPFWWRNERDTTIALSADKRN